MPYCNKQNSLQAFSTSKIAETFAQPAVIRSLRIRVEVRANVSNVKLKVDSYSLCKRAYNITRQRNSTQLTQVACPESRLNTLMTDLVSVQRKTLAFLFSVTEPATMANRPHQMQLQHLLS